MKFSLLARAAQLAPKPNPGSPATETGDDEKVEGGRPACRFLKISKYKYEIAVKYQNMKYALVYSKYQNISTFSVFLKFSDFGAKDLCGF